MLDQELFIQVHSGERARQRLEEATRFRRVREARGAELRRRGVPGQRAWALLFELLLRSLSRASRPAV